MRTIEELIEANKELVLENEQLCRHMQGHNEHLEELHKMGDKDNDYIEIIETAYHKRGSQLSKMIKISKAQSKNFDDIAALLSCKNDDPNPTLYPESDVRHIEDGEITK